MNSSAGFFTRFGNGFSAHFSAFQFIHTHNLWKYVIWPAILGVLLGVGILWLFYFGLSSAVDNYLNEALKSDNSFVAFLLGIVKFFAKFLAFVISMVSAFIFYRVLSGIVIIPFLGPLLSRVEFILTGKSFQVSIIKDIINALLGIFIAIKYICIEIIVLLLSLFTGPLQPVIMAFVSGYFLGRGTFDYICEKEAESLAGRKVMVKQFRTEILGLGMAQFLFLLLPILGSALSAPLAITGAAIIYYEEK